MSTPQVPSPRPPQIPASHIVVHEGKVSEAEMAKQARSAGSKIGFVAFSILFTIFSGGLGAIYLITEHKAIATWWYGKEDYVKYIPIVAALSQEVLNQSKPEQIKKSNAKAALEKIIKAPNQNLVTAEAFYTVAKNMTTDYPDLHKEPELLKQTQLLFECALERYRRCNQTDFITQTLNTSLNYLLKAGKEALTLKDNSLSSSNYQEYGDLLLQYSHELPMQAPVFVKTSLQLFAKARELNSGIGVTSSNSPNSVKSTPGGTEWYDAWLTAPKPKALNSKNEPLADLQISEATTYVKVAEAMKKVAPSAITGKADQVIAVMRMHYLHQANAIWKHLDVKEQTQVDLKNKTEGSIKEILESKENTAISLVYNEALSASQLDVNKDKTFTMLLEESALKIAADACDDSGSLKKGISVEDYFNYAEVLFACNSMASKHSHIVTTIHTMYDKAANLFDANKNPIAALQVRLVIANRIEFSTSHKLYNMDQAILDGTKLQSRKEFGAYFSYCDTGMVNGGHLHAIKRNVRGQERNCFDLKLNSYARPGVNNIIESLSDLKMRNKLDAMDPLMKGLEISSVNDKYESVDGITYCPSRLFSFSPSATKISIQGVGEIYVSNSPFMSTMYNNIRVDLNPNIDPRIGLNHLHKILAILGLGSAVCESRPEDEERLKLLVKFRAADPSIAYKFERDPLNYSCSIECLKKKIKLLCLSNLDNLQIEKKEIYPGMDVWSLPTIKKQMKLEGAYGLMSGVYGSSKTLANIMRDGALSSEDRFKAGLFIKGVSSISDLREGSGDQVFTRLISTHFPLALFIFSGDFQILYDLEVLNRGGYAYSMDEFGSKAKSIYSKRVNLPTFAKLMNKSYSYNNEVMISHRIPPSSIRRVVVNSEKQKQKFIKELQASGITELNGKSLSDLIVVVKGDEGLAENMWNPNWSPNEKK